MINDKNTSIFYTEEGAIGTSDTLKKRYEKELVVIKEINGTYSICSIDYYLIIMDYVEFVYCTDVNKDSKWIED